VCLEPNIQTTARSTDSGLAIALLGVWSTHRTWLNCMHRIMAYTAAVASPRLLTTLAADKGSFHITASIYTKKLKRKCSCRTRLLVFFNLQKRNNGFSV